MRYTILLFIGMSIFLFTPMQAITLPDEEILKFDISYKWGLIHKDAGEATLIMKKMNGNYDIVLAAKTKPWADKIYQVRDTLIGKIRISDFKPVSYTKITHENGKYKKEELIYYHSGNTTSAIARRYRPEKGNLIITKHELNASGQVYDMLTIFYYIRKLDFLKLNKDKVYVVTIFSGKRKETLSISFIGKEKIKLKKGIEREAYHLKFSFTQKGGKKSSEDLNAWISTDNSHIPLLFSGKLPIGEIRATLLSGYK